MAEEIDLQKCNFRNFKSSVTLTLTLDRVEVTLVCISGQGRPTDQIILKSEKFVDGQMDRPEFQFIRPSLGRWPNKCSAVAEMGDRLATINIGRKEGRLLCPFSGELGPHLIQCRLGRDLPPYQVPSCAIQPFGHNRYGPKIGGCAPWGELGSHLRQFGRVRGLPPCQVLSWSIRLFGHNTPTYRQTDRTTVR